MKLPVTILHKCPLFLYLPPEKLKQVIEKTKKIIHGYHANQIIAAEGEECSAAGIILTGRVEIKKIFASGKSTTVSTMHPGNIFGEALMFADTNRYPSTIVSAGEAIVMFLPKESILEMGRFDPVILSNLLSLLSNKLVLLNKKIKYLSGQSIRHKLALYLMDQSKIQQRLDLTIPFSRMELAEELGVTRPSLCREMSKMKADNIIDYFRNRINIINFSQLERTALEGM